VTSGAGAAALACLDLLVELGLPRAHIWATDIEGVVYEGRTVLMDEEKRRYAQSTASAAAGRGHRRRRRLPWSLRRRSPQGRDGGGRWPRGR